MPGQPSSSDAKIRLDGGHVAVTGGAGMAAVSILDARMPQADGDEALRRLEHQAGAAVAAIREQGAAFRSELLSELNQAAGGQAPPSVMALADLATGALISLHMQRYMTMGSFGAWAESELDASANRLRESAEKSQRNLAGLAVIARDLLKSAREAALEAGRLSKGHDALGGLLESIGATPARSPIDTPGGSAFGSPRSSTQSPSPNSEDSE